MDDKLINHYNLIKNSGKISEKTAQFIMFTGESYSYAILRTNEINGLQGKNRMTFNGMPYDQKNALNYDIDLIVNEDTYELLISLINSYLADKLVDPGEEWFKVTERKVRALYVILFTMKLFDIIPYLNTPDYLLDDVSDIYDDLTEDKLQCSRDFSAWLRSHGNPAMADITDEYGEDFWGTLKTKAIDRYKNIFSKLIESNSIHNPVDTYKAYLQYWNMYLKVTRTLKYQDLSSRFGLSIDQYKNCRKSLIRELNDLYLNDETAQALKLLIYEE